MATQLWMQEDTQRAAQTIMERAATDRSYRQRALGNPNEVVEEAAGKELPDGITIRFVENQATYTFVLPDLITEDQEISDSELEQVAGGRGNVCGGSNACAGAATEASIGICL